MKCLKALTKVRGSLMLEGIKGLFVVCCLWLLLLLLLFLLFLLLLLLLLFKLLLLLLLLLLFKLLFQLLFKLLQLLLLLFLLHPHYSLPLLSHTHVSHTFCPSCCCRYKRLFCIGRDSIATLNPNTFEETNRVSAHPNQNSHTGTWCCVVVICVVNV